MLGYSTFLSVQCWVLASSCTHSVTECNEGLCCPLVRAMQGSKSDLYPQCGVKFLKFENLSDGKSSQNTKFNSCRMLHDISQDLSNCQNMGKFRAVQLLGTKFMKFEPQIKIFYNFCDEFAFAKPKSRSPCSKCDFDCHFVLKFLKKPFAPRVGQCWVIQLSCQCNAGFQGPLVPTVLQSAMQGYAVYLSGQCKVLSQICTHIAGSMTEI